MGREVFKYAAGTIPNRAVRHSIHRHSQPLWNDAIRMVIITNMLDFRKIQTVMFSDPFEQIAAMLGYPKT